MTSAEKKALTERDICTRFITPALTVGNKWDLLNQIREEVYFTKGRVIVRGQLSTRGEPKRADYLYKPGIQLAIVEAKDNGAGMQQDADQGIEAVESPDALKIVPFPQIGTPVEIIQLFGGRNQYHAALNGLKNQLYSQGFQ